MSDPADIEGSQWTPLPMLAHGRIIKSFNPTEAFPGIHLSSLHQNLFFGDEVFLFETNDSDWAKGYLIVRSMPSDFIGSDVDLDKLPEMKVSVVLMPLSHVEIVERLPLTNILSLPALSDFDYPGSEQSQITSLYELEQRNSDMTGVETTVRAPLPLIGLNTNNLLDEILPSLSQLSSHIFALYSISEHTLFEKLYELFENLNHIRLKLQENLYTANEAREARLQAALLLTKVAKLLSSKGVNRFNSQTEGSAELKSDPSGFQTIAARDVTSGELYNVWNEDVSKQPIPKLIAVNQICSALQPNFPVTNNLEELLHPLPITKFDKVTPSQILVDFKDVNGTSQLNPQGFAGMTAYLFLRTAKKRLTEAFAIHIRHSRDFSLDKISAALFRNIPGTEVDNGRIYLVAIITEEIKVPKPASATVPTVPKVRKGLVAGVTDISRIFSRHKGNLESGKAHQFTIKLFGSYVNRTDNTKMDRTNMNFGWGELIDRIIAGSAKGVAVNPRAERLIVSIKEFKDDLSNVANDFDANLKTPIFQIRTNFFDPLVKPHDRLYVSLGKITITDNSSPFPGDLVSVQLINETPESRLKISKATNEVPGDRWNFTSVRSNEVIGEMIKVSNLEKVESEEKLSLKLFVNYQLRAVAEFIVSSEGNIYEYHKNQIITFTNPKTKKVEGTVEVTSEYIGKSYNIESSFHQIMNWRRLFPLPDHEEKLIEALKRLNQATLPQVIKYFKELLNKLKKILKTSISLKLDNLKNAAFYSFIHLLDIVAARQEQYTYLFHEYIQELSNMESTKRCLIGSDLISICSGYFGNADKEWKFVGRTLSRILPLLVEASVLLVDRADVSEFHTCWNKLAENICSFVMLKVESMIPDQLLILEYTDLTMEHLRTILDDADVIAFGINLIDAVSSRVDQSNPTSESMINSLDPSKSRKNESKISVTKLLLIRRLLNGFIFSNDKIPEHTVTYFVKSINWSIEAYEQAQVTTDLDVMRLANSVLVSCCNLCWTILVEKKEILYVLPRNISRLLLTIARLIITTHQFTRSNGFFEPKRNYTAIFPNAYPFNELITDSIIHDVVFVEILVELSVIYSFITKIAKTVISNSSQGILLIFELCETDQLFNSSRNFASTLSKEDLFAIIQTNRLLLQGKFFPSEKWISLYSLLVESITTASELIKFAMIRDHIPIPAESNSFDRSLWSRYLRSVLAIATSMPSAICHLSQVPRKAAWKITGDVRSRCAVLISQAWDRLGWDSLKRDFVRFQVKKNAGYHAEFIQGDYGILEELIILCLQRHSLSQITGVKILWTIMIAELLVQENCEDPIPNKLIELEKEILLGVDKFYKSGRYKPGLYEQYNLIKRLKMAVKLDSEDESFSDVYNFIVNLGEFLEAETDLTSVPRGKEFDDERTFHKLDISSQLMRVTNAKKFNAALDDLYEANLLKGNHVQAALSLELMASHYEWSVEEILPVSFKPQFPSETAFERKEKLYKRIAEELIRGNKLEKAVLIYKELADAYDKINFDLNGLSFVHEQLSDLYSKLTSLDRETPSYFKVSFIGLGFPKTVRSRSFIYEGLPFEHITSMHNRLLRLHTGAQLMQNDEAQIAMKDPPPGKYLNIVALKPQTDFNHYYGNLSRAARLYMQNKDLKFFTTSKRLQKSTSVLDLWVEETTYESYNAFPTLMNRSEVANITVVKLSPIQNALKTLSTKTQDLVNAESSAEKLLQSNKAYSNSSAFNELSRNLSGTVNSPVNGGIGQYKEFFDIEVNPEDEEAVNEISLLHHAFDNLTLCIYRCLLIHGKMVPYTLRDSHVAMLGLFEKNFATEIKRTGLNVQNLSADFAQQQSSGESTPLTLSKVPSMQTIGTSSQSVNVGTQSNGVSSRAMSMASTSSLGRVDTRTSDRSTSLLSQTTNTTQKTNGSGGKKKFLMSWRQSRLE